MVEQGGVAGDGARTSRERIRVRFYAALMVGDILLPMISFVGMSLILDPAAVDTVIEFALTLSALYLGFASYGRAYTVDILLNWRRGTIRAYYALAIAYVAAVGVAYYAPAFDPPTADIVAGACASCLVLITLSRYLAATLGRRVLGDSPIGQVVLIDNVPVPQGTGRQDVVIDVAAHQLAPRLDDPIMLDRIGRLISRFDRVVIACPVERRAAWAGALKGGGIKAELLIPEFVELGPLGASYYAGESTVIVANGVLELRERIIKRSLDLAVAGAALVFLMPLLVAVVLLIKLDSPGPALFVQARLGRGNKLFSIYKFRTMHVDPDADSAVRLASRNDMRVTRIGRFLRQTSIDELPQLLNVLRGEMSLVGPRPHAAGATAAEELYWALDERYFHRHAAKPGMTGLAQSRGFRGTTETTADLLNRLQADLEYLRDWTIWRDIGILLRTIGVVARADAY